MNIQDRYWSVSSGGIKYGDEIYFFSSFPITGSEVLLQTTPDMDLNTVEPQDENLYLSKH